MAKERGFTAKDLMDNVQLKNRVVDAPVTILHNKEEYTWQPGEVRSMPRKLAQWMLRKGWYKWIAGNTALGRRPEILNKLVILNTGKDESDLRVTETDALTLVPITKIDPTTGKALRMVAINPTETGADSAEMALAQRDAQVRETIKKAVTADAAAKIEKAADEANLQPEQVEEVLQRAGFKPGAASA